jgi:hypothetical protein
VQTNYTVDPPYVTEFIRICQMSAIPSDQKVATVIRCQGKMKRVPKWVRRHQLVSNVGFDDLANGVGDFQDSQWSEEGDRAFLPGKIPTGQLVNNSRDGPSTERRGFSPR